MTSLMCLALVVYFEARGETTMGQYAVAEVVMNRVEDKRYPNTVCGAVFEDRQFSFTHDGKPDRLPSRNTKAKRKALQIASDVLGGSRMGMSSTHYHTTAVEPYWASHYDRDGRVGRHVFYTNNTKYK